jgi:Protein of unknown function (DUF2892).
LWSWKKITLGHGNRREFISENGTKRFRKKQLRGGNIMICNVGKIDKSIRLIIGVVIAVLGLYYQSWWGLLAIIPILTAIFGFCALYIPFKINTCKKE